MTGLVILAVAAVIATGVVVLTAGVLTLWDAIAGIDARDGAPFEQASHFRVLPKRPYNWAEDVPSGAWDQGWGGPA